MAINRDKHYLATVGMDTESYRTANKNELIYSRIDAPKVGIYISAYNVSGKDTFRVLRTAGKGGKGGDQLMVEFTEQGVTQLFDTEDMKKWVRRN